MSRSVILKFRCTPQELDTLQAQLKDGQNISELIRQRLGLDQLNGQVDARNEVNLIRSSDEVKSNPLPTVEDPRRLSAKGVIEPVPQRNKQRRGWGWLWWLLVAAVVLVAIYFVSQIQIYYMGG